MPNRLYTTFQNMNKVFNGAWGTSNGIANTEPTPSPNDIIYKTEDPEKFAQKKLEHQQNQYLRNRWVKTSQNLSLSAFAGLNNVKLMYRDADLMDSYPEIGAAIDIIAEEATLTSGSRNGMIVNVSSKSERIKSILEDLFVNRLNLQVSAPMVVRSMCKYGNQFMLLDIDKKLGVKGWKQLPVSEVERVENGITNPYGEGNAITLNSQNPESKDLSTQFIWTNEQGGEMVPFRNWQIAHFRLLTNSIYLPYGVSMLFSARRHFRMLALMEDMMLIYRLERSMERRVFKIYVGALDDEDIEPYINQIANQFKRTPIVDPLTGQLDLRKNLLGVSEDFFIPTRTENAANPIDTLSGAKNLDAIDDIKYIQKKVCAALRIPQTFLNFEEAQGDGKNLALMDVRFARTINRYQQAFLMELTKVATIHLYLLGFEDDLTNFTLSMNNPSTQAELLETENMEKKISCLRDAVSDPGNGIPPYSMQRALKEIMKWSDKDIKENLEEIRIEKALAAELEKTSQIIKRSGVFDNVDRIYGESGAEYQDGQDGPGGDGPGGMGAPSGGGGFGGGLDDMGAPGMDDMAVEGEEGMEPTADMEMAGSSEGGPEGGAPAPEAPMESAKKKKPLITEKKNVLEYQNRKTNKLFNMLIENMEKHNDEEDIPKRVDAYDKALMINDEFNEMLGKLDSFKKERENE